MAIIAGNRDTPQTFPPAEPGDTMVAALDALAAGGFRWSEHSAPAPPPTRPTRRPVARTEPQAHSPKRARRWKPPSDTAAEHSARITGDRTAPVTTGAPAGAQKPPAGAPGAQSGGLIPSGPQTARNGRDTAQKRNTGTTTPADGAAAECDTDWTPARIDTTDWSPEPLPAPPRRNPWTAPGYPHPFRPPIEPRRPAPSGAEWSFYRLVRELSDQGTAAVRAIAALDLDGAETTRRVIAVQTRTGAAIGTLRRTGWFPNGWSVAASMRVRNDHRTARKSLPDEPDTPEGDTDAPAPPCPNCGLDLFVWDTERPGDCFRCGPRLDEPGGATTEQSAHPEPDNPHPGGQSARRTAPVSEPHPPSGDNPHPFGTDHPDTQVPEWAAVVAEHCGVSPHWITTLRRLDGDHQTIRFVFPPDDRNPPVAHTRKHSGGRMTKRIGWEPSDQSAEYPNIYRRAWTPDTDDQCGMIVVTEGETTALVAAALSAAVRFPNGRRVVVYGTPGAWTNDIVTRATTAGAPVALVRDSDRTGRKWATRAIADLERAGVPWSLLAAPPGGDLRAAHLRTHEPGTEPPRSPVGWAGALATLRPVAGRKPDGTAYGWLPLLRTRRKPAPPAPAPGRSRSTLRRPLRRTDTMRPEYRRADALRSGLVPALDELLRTAGYRPGRRADIWHCGQTDNHTHGDRNPSVSADLEKGVFKCHGCGVSGDRVTLAADLERTTTAEYLRGIYDRMRELDGYKPSARRSADDQVPDHIYDNDHPGAAGGTAGGARTARTPADDDRLVGGLLDDTEG